MAGIRGVFFWFSGVYTPPLPTVLAQALGQAGGKAANPYSLPDFVAHLERLATGWMDGLAFCEALGRAAGVDAGPATLRDRILDGLTPNQGAIEATRFLPETTWRWLVVDLPQDWFDRISERLGVEANFAVEERLFLPAGRLRRLIPDGFDHLVSWAQLPMQECFLIDASARRTVQALNHGLPAEVFVDGRRLEREFVMRGLIDRPQPVHKPDTSL